VSASLVITVDTEPDDQWAPPGPDGRLPPFTFANTRGLGRLKDFLHELGAPVTWMTSYAVARDPESARMLRQAAAEGDEIAGHLHGWETPPFTEVDRTHRPFLYEYPEDVRFAKHASLVTAHEEAFEARPFSYRAGRWGLDATEYEHLEALGYGIDSSIPPGIDFRDRSGLRRTGPDFRRWLSGVPPRPFRVGGLWEVPVSITPVGRLGSGALAAGLSRVCGARHRPSSPGQAAGKALEAAGLLRLVWVRPLKHPRADLVRAALSLVERGAPILNVMFHSSEAFAGTSPISRRSEDVERFFGDLAAIVRAATGTGRVTPRTLREAVAVCPPGAPV
jgi:hypothetical protein